MKPSRTALMLGSALLVGTLATGSVAFAQDTQAKQAKGDGLNGFGGTWHVVTVKATKAKSDTPTTNAGTGGVSF